MPRESADMPAVSALAKATAGSHRLSSKSTFGPMNLIRRS